MNKPLVKVLLHGRLGDAIGHEWNLSVKTPAQAIRLIEANTKKFYKFMVDASERNMPYQILIGDKPIGAEEEINCTIGKASEIHIIPVPEGSKSALGKIIAAIVIIILVVVAQQYELLPSLGSIGAGTAAAGGFSATTVFVTLAAYSVATSLIVGGITQLIVGNPKTQNYGSEQNNPSYLFNGPVNTVRQGNPVPLCYGKVLCGSALISLQISSADITAVTSTQTEPSGDETDPYASSGGGTAFESSESPVTPLVVDTPFHNLGLPEPQHPDLP